MYRKYKLLELEEWASDDKRATTQARETKKRGKGRKVRKGKNLNKNTIAKKKLQGSADSPTDQRGNGENKNKRVKKREEQSKDFFFLFLKKIYKRFKYVTSTSCKKLRCEGHYR